MGEESIGHMIRKRQESATILCGTNILWGKGGGEMQKGFAQIRPSFTHLPASGSHQSHNPPPASTHTSMRVLAQEAGAPVAGLVPHSSGMRPAGAAGGAPPGGGGGPPPRGGGGGGGGGGQGGGR
jgi:hypothetical protein